METIKELLPFGGDLTVVGMAVGFAMLVITDRLVWHTRLTRAEAQRDRWEQIALDALTTGAQAGVRAAEISNEVLSRLPDTKPEERST